MATQLATRPIPRINLDPATARVARRLAARQLDARSADPEVRSRLSGLVRDQADRIERATRTEE